MTHTPTVTDLAIYLIGGLSTIAETPRYMRVIPSIPEADGVGWIEVPSVTSTSTSTVAKWTLRNDEWVEVMFAIHQGPGGRYERPTSLKENHP